MFRRFRRTTALGAMAVAGGLVLTGLSGTASLAGTPAPPTTTPTSAQAASAPTASAPTTSTPTASAPTAPTPYGEKYRPQVHFTLPKGWIGDPNGLVYRNGLYYLYSYGTWEGAVSKDLVHWKDIPVTAPALDPGSNAFYSGSAVTDTLNTSGLGTRKNPPMVAVYTSVQQATGVQNQSMAYSLDQGRTWTRYADNPIIDIGSQNFRDPKVFWYAPKHEWLMAVTLSDQYKVSFYSSPNLKDWTHVSDFGPAGATTGVWEMPDLYQLPVDGDKHKTKWVLTVSVGSTGVQYFVGQFDGTRFTADGPATYTAPTGTPLDSFDSGSYGDWTTTGTAFGGAPATGALPDQQPVTGFGGSHVVNSYNGGDASTGTLTSSSFTIDKPHLNFQVGGGDNPYSADAKPFGTIPDGTVFADFTGAAYGDGWTATGAFQTGSPTTETIGNQLHPSVLDTYNPGTDTGTGTISSPAFTIDSPWIDLQVAGGEHPWGQANPTSVNLVIGGKVVETTTGANSGTLNWTNWDTSAYQGQRAQIQIVDDNDGSLGWGHLIVGDILFAKAAASPWDTETGVNLLVDGRVVRSTAGPNSETLDWASWDLSDLQGERARIQIVDNATGGWGHVLADDFSLSDEPALNQIQRSSFLDYGSDFYAANTWNDAPDGQRIGIAWMNNWAYATAVPTTPWQGQMTLPRTISLKTIKGKVQLVQQPVATLQTLRTGHAFQASGVKLTGTTTSLAASGDPIEIQTHLTAGTASTFGLNVRSGNGQYTQIGYDTKAGRLYVDRSHSGDVDFSTGFTGRSSAPLALDRKGVTLHVVVDASSVEVFADDGRIVLTEQILPDPTSTGISAFSTGGTAKLDSIKVWQLKSIWK